jgi:hypothetical protein
MSNFDEEQKAASAKAKADIETLIAAITSTSVKTAVGALFTDILNYGSVCSAQKLHALEQTISALADYVAQEGNPVDEIQQYRQRAFATQHPCRCPVCERYDARTQGNMTSPPTTPATPKYLKARREAGTEAGIEYAARLTTMPPDAAAKEIHDMFALCFDEDLADDIACDLQLPFEAAKPIAEAIIRLRTQRNENLVSNLSTDQLEALFGPLDD